MTTKLLRISRQICGKATLGNSASPCTPLPPVTRSLASLYLV
ncbi:hypothetical protein E2C01_096440 [Portunus trituberculatus]|uniref:Uncharacterized protein n=1 Tax=Portunus trituberculatus TaxID=210409 RepID=A0A5B7K2S2_PORTR|nr:hypothetical protein [Portunus trituberculatus]